MFDREIVPFCYVLRIESEKSNINLHTNRYMGEKLPNQILDDMEGMQKLDKSNMLGFCVNAADHYLKSAKNARTIKLDYPTPENVVIAGMGGSAIGGELLKDYTRETAKVPIEISRDYHLPAYAGKRSLAILASYSGDTEETLSSFVDALNRHCMVFCVSSGGNLIKYAKKLSVPYVKVQGSMPPRAAMPHMLLPLLACMEKFSLGPKFSTDFSETTKLLERLVPTMRQTSQQAKTSQKLSPKTLTALLQQFTVSASTVA